MSLHVLRVEVEVVPNDPALDASYPTLDLEYSYSPGRPAYTPRSDPPEAAEVELRRATLVDAAGLTLTQEQLDELAAAYLNDDAGYARAVENAESW